MTHGASPLPHRPEADASLATVLAALAVHDDKELRIDYAGRRTQPGYHVTEVKAGSFITLDCGSNPDAWQETVLQVEDIPARDGERSMTVRTFRNILLQVGKKVRLNEDARMTIEIGVPGEPMQVFDVAGIEVEDAVVVLQLGPRPAICKPRHRAAQEQASASCCAGSTKSSCC
jgi:hypothetical protein